MAKRILLFACIALALCATACAKTDADIVGTWQDVNAEEITQVFDADGNVYGYWEDTLLDSFPYTADGNEITIDQNGDSYVLAIDGDELTYQGETLYRKK
ncbi:hypothetical protein LJC56_10385 [Christensenellaceae bacterium OttesenSCG-928-K19]|nr:hypothetical protein [Christensenellaceae bacterium OttesenSCG-928-K19]